MAKKMTIEDLAGMVQRGFDGVDKKFEGVHERFNEVENKIEALRLEIENRLDSLEKRFQKIEYEALDDFRQRITRLEVIVFEQKKK